MSAASRWAGAVTAALLLFAAPAHANDSEAEIGIGGITLKQSSALVMASEDLYISEKIVRVTYRFDNPTDREISTTIAFPLPRQPRELVETHYFYEENRQDWSDFGFATKVDGAPVRLQMIERAMIGERDVTDRVIAQGWPLYWFENEANPFAKMGDAELAPWLAEGLATADDPLFAGQIVPAWDVATYFVREQSFPAGQSVTVSHEYAPVAGGSVGGTLHKAVRTDYPEGLAAYRERYCVDDHFLAGLDRRLAAMQKPGIYATYGETWLGYVLSSGANWAGPIGDFRLVVDKGSTDNLVSFCMNGVEKIAPTQFEVRKRDYEPDGDLNILIVKFYSYED